MAIAASLLGTPGDAYPRDATGFVRQCAWCRRVADLTGEYRLAAADLVRGASHGCCDGCRETLVASMVTMSAAARRKAQTKPSVA